MRIGQNSEKEIIKSEEMRKIKKKKKKKTFSPNACSQDGWSEGTNFFLLNSFSRFPFFHVFKIRSLNREKEMKKEK